MKRLPRLLWPLLFVGALVLAAGCGGGDDTPDATATPELPDAEDAIAEWVRVNRNVGFVGNCDNAEPGIDVGKLCMSFLGERGTRRAYSLGPTFSEPTAIAIVQDSEQGWTIVSVDNVDPSQAEVPGIDWPLQVGDRVVIIGVGENDCLRVREQPTQQGNQLACMPDGTEGIIQEGPVDAETFIWWRIAGDGYSGWAAGRWLRLPEAIADALSPPVTPTPEG